MTADDMTLLREYASNNSEAAFTTLVERHINLVYSVALRQLQDPSLAEEVTQVVFIILARKAPALSAKTILAGWLCRTARYASANALVAQRRRERREQEAYMQSVLNQSEAESWNQIAPLLDDALARLGRKDHDAVVLRFFENKSLNEVGVAIGTSADTARMRINRAVAKLRKFFLRRGVTLSTALIAGAVSANSVHAAPATLATAVATTALAKGAVGGASTLALTKGVLKLMAWTKAKTALAAAAAVLFVAGTTTIAVKQIQHHRPAPVIASTAGTSEINVKASFIEVPEEIARPLAAQIFPAMADNKSISSTVLPDAKSVLAKLRAQKGVNLIDSPSIITLSGHQAQIQVVDIRSVVTGFKPEALSPPGVTSAGNSNSVYQIRTNFASGPVLDVVPRLLANNNIVDLTVTASVNEFLGYAEPTNQVTVYVNGATESLPQPLPKISIREMTGKFQIPENQTLVLANPLDSQGQPAETPGVTKKYLFVFITPTIVTPTGKAAANSYPGDWIWAGNSRTLDRVPPIFILRPTQRPASFVPFQMFGKDRYLAEGKTLRELLTAVYSQKNSQLKLSFPDTLPNDKFDCIIVTTPPEKWWNTLDSEINTRFHLTAQFADPGTVIIAKTTN